MEKTMLRTIVEMFKQTFKEWQEDDVPRLAAALSYYVAFALAPLLVIAIAIAGFVFQQTFVREQVLSLIETSISPSAATFVGELTDNLNRPATGIISTILGLGVLLFGALGAFDQLKASLNIVWNVRGKEKRAGLRGLILGKLLSFSMVLMMGFLLLVSLILGTILSGVEAYSMRLFERAELVVRLVHHLFSFLVTVLVFAMLYRFLPDVKLRWRDVMMGALLTAILFTIGRYLLGLYLVNSSTANVYGAAGSFVLIMLWINYSSQIVLFGAEFTQVFSRRYGSLRDADQQRDLHTVRSTLS
jgi:membrane protein